MLKDLSTVAYHQTSEKLTDILCKKTQNANPLFFRVLVAYYFAKVASMMRCSIDTPDRGLIPVNVYALNLAVSGSGKGHSTNILEEQVINQFRERFLEETFPEVSETNLAKLATRRAIKKNTDDDDELARVYKEFEDLGNLAFSFDSGTTAAVKQMRLKLLMANAGSMNLEIDEIGSNLLGNIDVLTTFLELYDVGKVKQKLTKNTAENKRGEDIVGRTPTNLLLFGTPSKLLNGGKTEEEFYSMLDTGYARRCIFGYSKGVSRNGNMTPQELYDIMTDSSAETFINDLSARMSLLADPANFGLKLSMSKDVALTLISYKIQCESIAEALPEHDEIRKAEISHRYFKALKLAGAYAFVDESMAVTEDHLYAAIKLVEDSGEAFTALLTRERNYTKLAKYIVSVNREVTHVDLVEDLPFYKGSQSQKQEMMTLAIAYGYKNNIIIKRHFENGIEFLRGESLKETNIEKLIIAHSGDLASGYVPDYAPFDKLDRLTQQPNYNWTNHHLIDNYRKEDNAKPGFNMVVLDIDDGTPIDTVRLLLKDYTYHIHTTKSHTPQFNRFRVILPISHVLHLDSSEFKEFMQNIYEWLPFEVDTATGQRSRKWATHKGDFFSNEGQLLDALQFIPKTSKNDERKNKIQELHNLNNLERWFINHTGTGNRSNQLIKYALLLVDSGMPINQVQNNVLALNSKLQDKMDEAEVLSTIMVTASKRHNQKSGN